MHRDLQPHLQMGTLHSEAVHTVAVQTEAVHLQSLQIRIVCPENGGYVRWLHSFADCIWCPITWSLNHCDGGTFWHRFWFWIRRDRMSTTISTALSKYTINGWISGYPLWDSKASTRNVHRLMVVTTVWIQSALRCPLRISSWRPIFKISFLSVHSRMGHWYPTCCTAEDPVYSLSLRFMNTLWSTLLFENRLSFELESGRHLSRYVLPF